MSRKHHCPKTGASGGYKRRLKKRGITRSPMTHYPDLDQRGKGGRSDEERKPGVQRSRQRSQ